MILNLAMLPIGCFQLSCLEELGRIKSNTRLLYAEEEGRFLIGGATGADTADDISLGEGHAYLHLDILKMVV